MSSKMKPGGGPPTAEDATRAFELFDAAPKHEPADALRVGSEWFATTLRSIGDAVIATDDGGRVTFMNAVAEELTGWSAGDAKGHPLTEVFHIINEHTRLVVESPVTKVLREGVVVGLANHTLLVRRDGSEIAIDDSGAPIRDPSGKLVGVVLVFRDVTAKRHDEDRRMFIAQASAVLASSLDYATTLAAVARLAVPHIADWCAVHIIEQDGTVRPLAFAHVNDSKTRLLHERERRFPFRPEAASPSASVLRTGNAVRIEDATSESMRRDPTSAEELELLRRLGCRSCMVVPLRARGRSLGIIVLVSGESNRRYDADDLSLAEQLASAAALAVDNARLYAEAQEASRLKDEFLATLSHELRTPLNAMLGWTRLLASGPEEPDRIKKGLAIIERNARAQARLVEDLLDVSRIITGKMALDIGPVDMASMVETAIEANRPAADAKGVRIDARLDRMVGPVSGDSSRLQQIAWNLLANAVKFTPRGGHVAVNLTRTGSQVELTVSDTGQGIAPAFLPFVFDRFRQGDSSVTKVHTGLGLGLAIVKHLAELHGGAVRAASEGEGKGATFAVTLPVQSMRDDEASPLPPLAPLARVDGLTVLVVDDEPDNRDLLKVALEESGAKVVAVASAADALVELRSTRPDVIVSDIGMPAEDGYALMRRIRVLPAEQGGRAPAIALTAHARDEDKARATLSGYQAHLAKPVDPTELVTLVATLASRRDPPPQ